MTPLLARDSAWLSFQQSKVQRRLSSGPALPVALPSKVADYCMNLRKVYGPCTLMSLILGSPKFGDLTGVLLVWESY